jgi:hypothetical protein
MSNTFFRCGTSMHQTYSKLVAQIKMQIENPTGTTKQEKALVVITIICSPRKRHQSLEN